MKLDLDEAITEAIMSDTPLVIVEGKDDIKFYETLASEIEKDICVYAVENLENFGQGCDSVVKAIEYLQPKISERVDNIRFVLGIIDRDARSYRNQTYPALAGLFVLKYYSYESHFATRNNLTKLITILTNVSAKSINEDILNYVESDLPNVFSDLYYISLEALMSACKQEYDAVVGYSERAGNIADSNSRKHILSKLEDKKIILDQFAMDSGLSSNDIRLLVKGKWYLYAYCSSVLSKIKNLSALCVNGIINKCQYCNNHNEDKCLWGLGVNYNFGQVYNIIINSIDKDEVDYIINRLSQLGVPLHDDRRRIS